MSTARWGADQAVTKLSAWTDAEVANRRALLVQANVYAGFSYAALGMAMCQAAFDLGPLVDQKGMFALAEKRFSDAIMAATGCPRLRHNGRRKCAAVQPRVPGAIVQGTNTSVEPTARSLKTEQGETDPRSAVVQLSGKASDGITDKADHGDQGRVPVAVTHLTFVALSRSGGAFDDCARAGAAGRAAPVRARPTPGWLRPRLPAHTG